MKRPLVFAACALAFSVLWPFLDDLLSEHVDCWLTQERNKRGEG